MNNLLPLMTYCLIMSGTPGPNNVMLATSGANFGYRGAMPTVMGIQAGGFVQTCVTCLGLGSVFNAYPQVQHVLRIVGALYLVFLAWKLSGARMGDAGTPEPVSFTEAALFQALNPKSWVKAVTLASVFMPGDLGVLNATLLVALVSLIMGLPCSLSWAWFGASFRTMLNDPRKQRLFNLTMGATLLVLALMFLR